jgi:hypothetical protein
VAHAERDDLQVFQDIRGVDTSDAYLVNVTLPAYGPYRLTLVIPDVMTRTLITKATAPGKLLWDRNGHK